MKPGAAAPVQIWRTVFERAAAGKRGDSSLVPVPSERDRGDVVLDVVRQESAKSGRERYAVLFSMVAESGGDYGDAWRRKLTCFIAFSNDQDWANYLRTLGFDCVEAQIDPPTAPPGDAPTPLVVRVPFYSLVTALEGESPQADSVRETSREYAPFITLESVDFNRDAAMGSKQTDFTPITYHQKARSPEPANPTAEVCAVELSVHAGAASLTAVSTDVAPKLKIERSRYPDLSPIADDVRYGTGAHTAVVPTWPPQPGGTFPGPSRRPRNLAFATPAFRFRDVFSVGFRIDLDGFAEEADAMLDELIEPLNFHVVDAGIDRRRSITPFRFQAASRTIVVELLQYTKMISPEAPGLTPDDFTSQHELVVRILVGRVDDDSAQARSPAVYVPAIFVDNPWSKVFGRELLGYDKYLAHFCTGDDGKQIVSMAGTFGGAPSQVSAIRTLRVAPRIDDRPASQGAQLIQIQCPASALADLRFLRPAVTGVSSDLRATGPWTQWDFELPEFRRSFARTVLGDGFLNFASVQRVPVDNRGLPPTLITGMYSLDDVEVAFPAGIATLTFPNPPSELTDAFPPPWARLCRLLSRQPVALPTGDWYCLRCSMDLAIDEPFGGER
jgi:hypothetical protein